eukprot:11954807-Ditylum_brightwellii.AAC.1
MNSTVPEETVEGTTSHKSELDDVVDGKKEISAEEVTAPTEVTQGASPNTEKIYHAGHSDSSSEVEDVPLKKQRTKFSPTNVNKIP